MGLSSVDVGPVNWEKKKNLRISVFTGITFITRLHGVPTVGAYASYSGFIRAYLLKRAVSSGNKTDEETQ